MINKINSSYNPKPLSFKGRENHLLSQKTVRDYQKAMPEINIKDFTKYIDNIDFKKLYEIAPQIKDYDEEQLIAFLDYYYQKGISKFDKNTLTFNQDLTGFLSKNHLSSDNLKTFFTLFPLTQREVGSIPKGWLKKIPKEQQKEVQKRIYQIISDFQKNRNIKTLQEELSEALKQKVEIEKLNKGEFGTGYKIITDFEDSLCLKIFHDNANALKGHGAFIEPQTGIFVNKHSNKFVREIFGRVATEKEKDSFLATQYLDEGIKPYKNSLFSKGYKIVSTDAKKTDLLPDLFNHGYHNTNGFNMINDKIIDFGGVVVKKKIPKIILDKILNHLHGYSKYYVMRK